MLGLLQCLAFHAAFHGAKMSKRVIVACAVYHMAALWVRTHFDLVVAMSASPYQYATHKLVSQTRSTQCHRCT